MLLSTSAISLLTSAFLSSRFSICEKIQTSLPFHMAYIHVNCLNYMLIIFSCKACSKTSLGNIDEPALKLCITDYRFMCGKEGAKLMKMQRHDFKKVKAYGLL